MASRNLLTATGEALVFIATAERPTVAEIAGAVGVSRDHAFRILKVLKAEGYLSWAQPQGKGGANRYEISWEKCLPGREITVAEFVRALGRSDST